MFHFPSPQGYTEFHQYTWKKFLQQGLFSFSYIPASLPELFKQAPDKDNLTQKQHNMNFFLCHLTVNLFFLPPPKIFKSLKLKVEWRGHFGRLLTTAISNGNTTLKPKKYLATEDQTVISETSNF